MSTQEFNAKRNILSRSIICIDFFGIEPRLLINKKKRFNTAIGGILSLIVFIVVILVTYSLGREIYEKNKPFLTISSVYEEEPSEFQLNPSNFALAISIVDSYYQYFIDPQIYTPSMNFISNTAKLINNTFVRGIEYKEIKLESCNISNHFGDFKDLYAKEDLANSLCPEPESLRDLSLRGSFVNENFNFLNVSIQPCNNSTDSKIICKSQEEIDAKLNGGYIGLNFINTIFDPLNFNQPAKYIKNNFYTVLSKKYYKQVDIYFKNIDYNTDKGFLFEDITKETYLQLQETNELIDFREANIFFATVFRLSTIKDIYNRKYTKIQDVVAQVGGLIKGVVLIISLFYNLYAETDYYYQLANNLFHFTDTKGNNKYI
jgi:hypothetical protein